MSKEVVETIYGKHYRYEVVRETSTLGNPKYYVQCDDGSTSGFFSDLSDAVKWTQKKAEAR